RAFTRGETGWQELSPPSTPVLRLSACTDGQMWATQADGRTAVLPHGATTWAVTGTASTGGAVVTTKYASASSGDFWQLRSDGQLARAISTGANARETPVAFDAQPKTDSSYASRIDVWYDDAGIRSIQVVFPGHTFRCGDTGGTGVQQRASYTFGGADKLISV